MRILSIACESFRNLAPLRLEPHPGFNIIEGKNGQGKTNLLEVIYVMATLRSFRETRLRNLIGWDQDGAWIRSEVQRDGVDRNLAVELRSDGRRASLDGNKVRRLSDYFGHFHVVFFGPDDLSLTKGGPAGRRRFIDRAIFNVEPVYLQEVNDYLKALRHRNDLLRSGADRDVLASFDQAVISRGARILWRRSTFLQSFRPLFEEVFGQITDGQHKVSTSYQGLVSVDEPVSESDFEGLLAARLESSLKRDQRRGHTGDGPHMDDLVFHLDEHPARQHASQGQHRAFALSLKIAEMQYAKEALGSDPVLLLDDVSSELDRERNALLMRYLDQSGGQVFITTTDRSWIQITARSKVFQVDQGQVNEEDDDGGDVSQTSPYSA